MVALAFKNGDLRKLWVKGDIEMPENNSAETTVGKAASIQTELDALAKDIRLNSEPLFPKPSPLEEHSGVIGSALDWAVFGGGVATQIIEKETGLKGLSDGYGVLSSAASGTGELLAGNTDDANDELIKGIFQASKSKFGEVAMDITEAVEDILEGDFRGAAGNVAEAFSDAASGLATGGKGTLKAFGAVVEDHLGLVSTAVEASNLADKTVESIQADSSRAGIYEHAESMRKALLDKLESKYWAKVQEARAEGIEPKVDPWMNRTEKRDSGDLADTDTTKAAISPDSATLHIEQEAAPLNPQDIQPDAGVVMPDAAEAANFGSNIMSDDINMGQSLANPDEINEPSDETSETPLSQKDQDGGEDIASRNSEAPIEPDLNGDEFVDVVSDPIDLEDLKIDDPSDAEIEDAFATNPFDFDNAEFEPAQFADQNGFDLSGDDELSEVEAAYANGNSWGVDENSYDIGNVFSPQSTSFVDSSSLSHASLGNISASSFGGDWNVTSSASEVSHDVGTNHLPDLPITNHLLSGSGDYSLPNLPITNQLLSSSSGHSISSAPDHSSESFSLSSITGKTSADYSLSSIASSGSPSSSSSSGSSSVSDGGGGSSDGGGEGTAV